MSTAPGLPSRDYAAIARQYAADVVSGRIPAGKQIRLQCERFVVELVRSASDDFPYRFDEAKAARPCRFIERLPHTKGVWAKQKKRLTLEPWQVWNLCCVFGWLHKSGSQEGTRRFRRWLLVVPRKNGKSAIASGVALFMLCADGEYGAEVYSGATNEKQALEVFRPAKLMVSKLPALKAKFEIENLAKQLLLPDGSRMETIIGDPGDAEKVDGELAMLLNEAPNPEWSSFAFRQYFWQQVFTGGRGLAWIERRGTKPVAIWPLDPTRTTARRQGGRKIYRCGNIEYPAADIIDVTFALRANQLDAYGPIYKGRKAIGLAIAMNDFAAGFFAGGGVPPLALEGPLPTGVEALKRAYADIRRAIDLARKTGQSFFGMPHRTYVEPFVGMGGIFLRRPTPAAVEVINDLAGDVANLFRVIRRHYEPFVDELRWLIAGRAEFQRQLAIDPTTLTDIDRAVRFLYLQRLAFGGRVVGRSFGLRRDQDSRIQLSQLRADLKALRDRLEPVTIEQLDYSQILRRYDGDRTLFFLDPPYDETTGYGLDFGHDQYRAMAEQLAGIQGSFIMSINDTPFIRQTFAGFAIEEIETTWTLSSAAIGRTKRVTELLIRNAAR